MTSGEARTRIDCRRLDAGQLESILSGDVDQRLREAAWALTPKVITLSRNVTVAVSRLCRNRCAYCGFRDGRGGYLAWRDVLPLLRTAEDAGCCEALFMSGERPEEVYPAARRFLRDQGFRTTPEYVAWLCGRTLDETGLLPHTNIGILDADELGALRQVNASLGLMLEDASERLCGKGMPHEHSPGKAPKERLRTIDEAGRQRIPFTTGILVGLGQTTAEVLRSLLEIRRLAEEHGHIQEIIIQRLLPKRGTPMEDWATPPRDLMLRIFSVARLLFGERMKIQVPPNIERQFEEFILSGANDLGGVSPVTRDEINPEMIWTDEHEIINRVSSIGCRARHRPPVHENFATGEFLPPGILERALSWMDRYEAMEGTSS